MRVFYDLNTWGVLKGDLIRFLRNRAIEEPRQRKISKNGIESRSRKEEVWENGTSQTSEPRNLVGCSGHLTANRREYFRDLVTQGDKHRDGDHRNESENQGVLHESLALLALHPAQRDFSAFNYFVDPC
jgi:hypothetical protein